MKSKTISPSVCNLITLSTTHLTEKTRNDLTDKSYINKSNLSIYPNTFGCFLYVGTELDVPLTEDIPTDLQDCIRFARNHHCEWIKFDRDAKPLDKKELHSYQTL